MVDNSSAFNKALLGVAVRYGLIAGAVACVVIAALYYLGKHPFLLPVVFDFRIILYSVMVIFALREIRDFHLGKLLFFFQGMVASNLVVWLAALIGAAFVWVFAAAEREFLAEYIRVMTEQMTTNRELLIQNVGEEAYNQQMAKLPATTAGALAGDYFLKSIIIGLFLTIILSVIMRRQPKTI